MRKQFCDALVKRASNPDFVFLTGDLGFMALEPLRDALAERFINAGVAEQNMISVSAALARQGLEPWAYSIAPFCYARPFEQLRNDVAMHNLPVKIVGNGGGYAYGVMGPTHHAIDDYGAILTLPNMRVFVPVFDEDIEAIVSIVGSTASPCYLRLGRGEPPIGFPVPPYSPWRQLAHGDGVVLIAVGPLASTYIQNISEMPPSIRPNLWAVSEMPLSHNPLPSRLITQLIDAPGLIVAEEHVQRGGFASDLMLHLASSGISVRRFVHHFAQAHNYGIYGSQAFLRAQSALDAQSIVESVEQVTPLTVDHV